MDEPATRPDEVRTSGRMLPVRSDGRVLLLSGTDPARPGSAFWFSVGGGLEPGETALEAAVRELREETGIVVDPADVTPRLARHTFTLTWRGGPVVRDSLFFAVRVPDGTVAAFDGLTGTEAGFTTGTAWLTADELLASGASAHPVLVDVVRTAVAAVLGGVRKQP